MDHGFASVLVVFFIFGAPITAWIISRVLAHQERIEMIRNGFMPPPGRHAMRNAQRYGAWQSGPIPPPPGAPMPPNAPPPQHYADAFYAQAQMRKGIMVALIGLALLIGLGSIGPLSGIGFAGPWLLGGLIPLFVGIAQIINAILNGATIPVFGAGPSQANFGPRPMNQGQPQSPPPPAGSPSSSGYSGPYGWRPGPTPEIEKPVQPPDHV